MLSLCQIDDMIHYNDKHKNACLQALRETILMGYEDEMPIRLNDGSALHILYTEEWKIGVRSKQFFKLYFEALEWARHDAWRVLALYGAFHYNAVVDSQRDDVKFAVHTSPDGEATIMSKNQFVDWVCGYTGDYLRVYPYLAMDDALKESCVTTAKDDDGNDVILPILTIPQIEK